MILKTLRNLILFATLLMGNLAFSQTHKVQGVDKNFKFLFGSGTNTLLAVTDSGITAYTTNRGVTWRIDTLPTMPKIIGGLAAPEGQLHCLVSDSGRVYRRNLNTTTGIWSSWAMVRQIPVNGLVNAYGSSPWRSGGRLIVSTTSQQVFGFDVDGNFTLFNLSITPRTDSISALNLISNGISATDSDYLIGTNKGRILRVRRASGTLTLDSGRIVRNDTSAILKIDNGRSGYWVTAGDYRRIYRLANLNALNSNSLVSNACGGNTRFYDGAFIDLHNTYDGQLFVGENGQVLVRNRNGNISADTAFICNLMGTTKNLLAVRGVRVTENGIDRPIVYAVGDSGTFVTNDCPTLLPAKIARFSDSAFCKNNGAVIFRDTTGLEGYDFQWFRNGSQIPGATSSTLVTSDSGNFYLQRIVLRQYFRRVTGNPSVFYSCFNNSDTLKASYLATPEPVTLTAVNNDTLFASGGHTFYQWQVGNQILTDTTAFIVPQASGTYIVRFRGPNGCLSDASNAVNFTLCSTLNNVLSGPADTTVCQGRSVRFAYTPTQPLLGISYRWFRNGNPIAGQTGNNITASDSGLYSLEVRFGNCTIITNSLQLRVEPLPARPVITTAGGSLSFCAGDSITLIAPEAAAYRWTVGASSVVVAATREFVVNSSRTGVRVVLESALGCLSTASDPVNTTMVAVPNRPVITRSGNNLTASVSPILQGLTYRWFFNGTEVQGVTGNTLTNPSEGSYRVLAFNGANNLCPSDTSVEFLISSLSMANHQLVKVYPNPVNRGGRLVLQGLELGGRASIEIMNLKGQTLVTESIEVEGLTTLPIVDLKSGVYVLSIVEANTGRRQLQKIIVD